MFFGIGGVTQKRQTHLRCSLSAETWAFLVKMIISKGKRIVESFPWWILRKCTFLHVCSYMSHGLGPPGYYDHVNDQRSWSVFTCYSVKFVSGSVLCLLFWVILRVYCFTPAHPPPRCSALHVDRNWSSLWHSFMVGYLCSVVVGANMSGLAGRLIKTVMICRFFIFLLKLSLFVNITCEWNVSGFIKLTGWMLLSKAT